MSWGSGAASPFPAQLSLDPRPTEGHSMQRRTGHILMLNKHFSTVHTEQYGVGKCTAIFPEQVQTFLKVWVRFLYAERFVNWVDYMIFFTGTVNKLTSWYSDRKLNIYKSFACIILFIWEYCPGGGQNMTKTLIVSSTV